MRQRHSALVNVNMTPEEVADVLGCIPSDLVSYGNGYAVTDTEDGPLVALDALEEE